MPETSLNDVRCGDCLRGPLWDQLAPMYDTGLARVAAAAERGVRNIQTMHGGQVAGGTMSELVAADRLGTQIEAATAGMLGHITAIRAGFEASRDQAAATNCAEITNQPGKCPRLELMMAAGMRMGEQAAGLQQWAGQLPPPPTP